jgi:hypothetical protein
MISQCDRGRPTCLACTKRQSPCHYSQTANIIASAEYEIHKNLDASNLNSKMAFAALLASPDTLIVVLSGQRQLAMKESWRLHRLWFVQTFVICGFRLRWKSSVRRALPTIANGAVFRIRLMSQPHLPHFSSRTCHMPNRHLPAYLVQGRNIHSQTIGLVR